MAIYILPIVIACFILAVFSIRILTSKFSQVSSQNRLLKALRSLDKLVLSSPEIGSLYQGIVDVIHKELGFTFAILALVDKKTEVIRRVAISLDPDSAQTLHELLPVKFKEQIVPFSNTENLFTKVMLGKTVAHTRNLYDIQIGILPQEVSAKIQRIWKLKSVFLYPILIRDEVVGVLEYSSIKEKEKLSSLELVIMEEFTAEVSRALDNAFLYQNLRETTNQLIVANEKLQGIDRLKDEFVSVTSHELRTPMTAIRSYAWMALHRSDVPLSQKMEKYIVRILMSAERLINLVNDMLNISRIESGKIEIIPERVDIILLTKDIVDEAYYSKAMEKNIHISIMEEKLPPVFADPEKLRQVMLNIIGNAVKFVPEGGHINVSFFTDGRSVEVSVSDSGPGISKEDLTKLFKKFSRLDNTYSGLSMSGGTGLGLYISKNIIELMHGRIWARSDGLGKGSTFTFSLPVASEEILAHAGDYKVEAKGEAKGLEPAAI